MNFEHFRYGCNQWSLELSDNTEHVDSSKPGKSWLFSSQGFLSGFMCLRPRYVKMFLGHLKFCFKSNMTVKNPTWSPNCIKYYFYSASAYLAMQSAVLAMIDSVCLHVFLSQSGIMPHESMTLVSSWLTALQNSQGNIGSGGAKWERGRKIRQLLANKSPYLRNGAR